MTAASVWDATITDPEQRTIRVKIEAWVDRIEHNAFGVIYGSVTVMALLMATGHGGGALIETSAILFGSIFAIALAESFAKISSVAVQKRQSFGWSEVYHGWVHSRPTLIAANIPTLLIAAASLGFYEYETSIALAQISAIILLALCGYSIGWVIYRRVVPGLLHGAFTSGIGVALAVLNYLLHLG